MAEQFSIPLGDLFRQIDFWDQPTDPDPSTGQKQPDQLVFQNVQASIEDLWTTTSARFLQQQILTEVSHRIYIVYQPGIFTRMYIIEHDIDYGDIRYDIASIGDPDGRKRFLRILAISRNDGQ